MKFSVAMCTYNGARYLPEQLASIAAQTRPPDELIVCDDRSGDDTAEVVEAFAAAAPFPVRLYVNEKNLGSTKNFEKAIGLCGGELIALSDQDDVWLPRKLERLEAAFSSEPGVGLAFSDAEVVDEGLRPLGYSLWQSIGFGEREQRRCREGAAFDMILGDNFVTGATMAFRARFKELVLPLHSVNLQDLGLPGSMIHDGWIALMVAAAARLVPIPEPLIKYRQHRGQQVGAQPPPAAPAEATSPGWRARAQARHTGSLSAELGRLRLIHGRLASKAREFDSRRAVAKLEAKMTHLTSRTTLPEHRLLRLPAVARELLALRYHRYSQGLLSAAKDLLR